MSDIINLFNINISNLIQLTSKYPKIIGLSVIVVFAIIGFGMYNNKNNNLSKKAGSRALGNASVPVNYPVFLQTDGNGNISTFDFETQNFKGLKMSGDIASEGNLNVTGDIKSNGKLTVSGITETNKLNVKTTNQAGETILNWTDGKNYLTGDTDFRGGAVTILNDTIPGRAATHFPHTPSKENWISGPTNFRQGGIKVEAGQTISIGGTSINEDELSKLKTFINLRKSISSGNVKLKWDGYTNVFTLSPEAHNWGIFTIKSAYSMSQYKLWYISGIVSSFELIQKTTGSTKVPNMNESIDVICDGAGNVTAKSTSTYPDCTWIYERYY